MFQVLKAKKLGLTLILTTCGASCFWNVKPRVLGDVPQTNSEDPTNHAKSREDAERSIHNVPSHMFLFLLVQATLFLVVWDN